MEKYLAYLYSLFAPSPKIPIVMRLFWMIAGSAAAITLVL